MADLALMIDALPAEGLRAVLKNVLMVAGEYPQEITARAVVYEIQTHHDFPGTTWASGHLPGD